MSIKITPWPTVVPRMMTQDGLNYACMWLMESAPTHNKGIAETELNRLRGHIAAIEAENAQLREALQQVRQASNSAAVVGHLACYRIATDALAEPEENPFEGEYEDV